MATNRKMDPADYEALEEVIDPNFTQAKTLRAGGENRVAENESRDPFDPVSTQQMDPQTTTAEIAGDSPELASNPFDPSGRETVSFEADTLMQQAQSEDELFMFDELPETTQPGMSETGVSPARPDLKMAAATDQNEFPLVDPVAPQEPFDQEAANREFDEYQEEQRRLSLLREEQRLLQEDDPTVDEDGFPVSERLQRSRQKVADENLLMDQRRAAREQGRQSQAQQRRDLRNWQAESRRAQREGRPIPPMPTRQKTTSQRASFSEPTVNEEGQSVVRIGEMGLGKDGVEINVTEDPTQPGKYIPQPGGNTSSELSRLAFDIDGRESMDHLLTVADESGISSATIDRFRDVQKAAKNLKREDFASDAQYEQAKADISEEYGVTAKQLVDRQKDFFRGRKKETGDALARSEAFSDDVMQGYRRAITSRNSDPYDQRSDQEVFRDSIIEVQRNNLLREGLMAQQTGQLSDRQSAQIPILGFAPSPGMPGTRGALPNQIGIPMQGGVGGQADQDQIASLDDSMRAKYEDLPFGVTTDNQGGVVIQHEELGEMPGLIVSGYDVPVAIAQNAGHAEALKRAGVPYVTPKALNEVVDQHVDLNERETGIEEFDVTKGTQEARENIAAKAAEQFKNAQAFAEDMAEYQSDLDAENLKQREHSGKFADPEFLKAQGIVPPEKDESKTGMYDAAIKARNVDLQSDYDQEYAEIQRQINEEGLPQSDADIEMRKLQKDFDERKSKPMTEQEFMATIGDEMVAEELSRLQQVHEQEQRVAQNVIRKQRNDYGPEFNQAYSRSYSNGVSQYTLRSTPRTFDPVPLRSVALGTGGARFPLAENPSHLASAAFDVPIVVRNRDGETMQTVIPSAPFRAATRDMNQRVRVINGVRIDPLAEATVNVANLIQQYYPGEMTRDELQAATEQMMRRHGYAEDSDFGA